MGNPVIIITVGTSLISNRGGVREDAKDNQRWKDYGGAISPFRPNARPEDRAERLHKHLVANGSLDRELGFRNSEGLEKDGLPQELSYLALRKTLEDHDVYLLASDSDAGRFCASAIKIFLDNPSVDSFKWYKVADLQPITGLNVDLGDSQKDVASPEEFASVGVPNLIESILDIIRERADAPQVILNFTGGFKGAIPYTTLAMLFAEHKHVSMEYLYGESSAVISLPRYPIGLDFALWHREANLLEAALSHESLYGKALDPRMAAVAAELRAGSNGLPRLLRNRYQEQRDVDPLQTFSERVVDQFLGERPDLAECLKRLIRETGPSIWVGDKVPMAAEHAARHHHDLLELTQSLLTPIADAEVKEGRPFLTQEERFVLLSAVLLHDCGHVVDALPLGSGKIVPLFKSEIRDLHHFLAYHRLGDEKVRGELGWQPPNDDLLQATRWLCVYHRRRTGWDDKSKPQPTPCPYLDLEVGTPCVPKEPLKSLLATLDGRIDFPKLALLIRLIDGCDNQNRRVGYGNLRTLTESALDRDYVTLIERIRLLLPAALASVGAAKLDSSAQDFLSALDAYIKKGADDKQADRPDWSQYKETREKFARALAFGSGTPEKLQAMALWTELLNLYDQSCMCYAQAVHFIKHEVVQRITILPGEQFDLKRLWHLHITLHENPIRAAELDSDETRKKYEKTLKDLTLRRWIEEEVVTEIREKDRPSVMIDYFAQAAGRPVLLTFSWKGEFDRIASSAVTT